MNNCPQCGAIIAFAEEIPEGSAPVAEQVAIAGPDGRRAVELLSRNQTHGQQLLAALTRRAVERMLANGNPQAAAVLFDDDELDEWAGAMSSMIATADLLGRARVRERARLAAERYGVKAFGWTAYEGPKGGRGWTNGTEVRYQDAMPDDEGDGGGEGDTEESAALGTVHQIDPDDLVPTEPGVREDLEELAQKFPEGEGYNAAVAELKPDGERSILDGHHRAKLAASRGDKLPVVYVTTAEKDKLLEAGFDQNEVTYAALMLSGETGSADDVATQWGRRFRIKGDKAFAMLADLRGVEMYGERCKPSKFAEEPDTFIRFDEPPPVQPPAAAVDYFSRLVPELGSSAARYGPLLDRFAFTLAHATDQALLDKVKKAILEELTKGENATPNVQAILDAAGVSVRNPAYAEMVTRTNIMDALSQGTMAELAEPEMQEFFPVWRYDGILDERTGDDHRPRIGKHYPSSVNFHEVRGPRVYNCRCSPTPISKWEAKGVRVESSW